MAVTMEKRMTRNRALAWMFVSVFVLITSFAVVWRGELHASEQTVTARQLLVAKSALNTAVADGGHMANCRESAIYLDWGTGVTSGAVTIETAVDQNYTGTWAPLLVQAFAATAPKQDVVQITGIHWAIRTRISTVLAGGVVNTWLVCN